MKIANIEAVLWNGNQITDAPDWIGEAVNQFNYSKPGYMIRMNKPTGNIINVGSPTGEVTAYPNDYIIRREDGSLDAWSEETLNKYKQANHIEC